MVGESIGPRVEMGVVDLLVLEEDRHGLGCALDLRLEPLVKAPGGRELDARGVELDEEVVALGVADGIERSHGRLAVCRGARQERRELVCDALGGVGAYGVGIKVERDADRLVRCRTSKVNLEGLEARGLLQEGKRCGVCHQRRGPRTRSRRQGMADGSSPPPDHRRGSSRSTPPTRAPRAWHLDPPCERCERLIGVDIDEHGQLPGEEPDGILDLVVLAAVAVEPRDGPRLPRQAREHENPTRQQDARLRDAARARSRCQARRQYRIERAFQHRWRAHRRARLQQLERKPRFDSRHRPLAPVQSPGIRLRPLEEPVLPLREVGILDRLA